MDLARSVQVVTEEIVLQHGRATPASVTGEKNLCLAGGVALNCVANGRLLREGPFEDIWIQPAAGDAGGALGAALLRLAPGAGQAARAASTAAATPCRAPIWARPSTTTRSRPSSTTNGYPDQRLADGELDRATRPS